MYFPKAGASKKTSYIAKDKIIYSNSMFTQLTFLIIYLNLFVVYTIEFQKRGLQHARILYERCKEEATEAMMSIYEYISA